MSALRPGPAEAGASRSGDPMALSFETVRAGEGARELSALLLPPATLLLLPTPAPPMTALLDMVNGPSEAAEKALLPNPPLLGRR